MSTPEEMMALALQANEAPPAETPLWYDRSQPDGGAAAELARLEAVPEGISWGMSPLDVAAVAMGPILSAALPVAVAIGGGGSGGSSLSWQDPQVNFPRGERIFVPGTEPPPPGRGVIPYEPPPQPGPWAFGIGGIGAILGGIIAATIESDFPGIGNIIPGLDPELGPYDTRAPAGAPEDPMQMPDDAARGEAEGPVPGSAYGPPGEGDPGQVFYPGRFEDIVFPTPDASVPEDVIHGPVPEGAYGPPAGARQPAPAPAPTAPAHPGLPPWVWPVIGGIGALQIGRAGRSRSSQTLPSISVLPSPGVPGLSVADVAAFIEPLLASNQLAQSATYPQTQTGDVWNMASSSETCSCTRKSGKKRKCLARAQLSWRSGPKKGRAAGSRCYRFAD